MSGPHNKKPFKRGSFKGVAEKRPRHIRTPIETDAKITDELVVDLIHAFASVGIQINNVRDIARKIVEKGWTRMKKVL